MLKGWLQGELYDPYIRHSLNTSSTLPDAGLGFRLTYTSKVLVGSVYA